MCRGDLMNRLQSLRSPASSYFDPDNWARMTATAKQLITLRAAGYAYQATFEYLALFSIAALMFVIFFRISNKKVC